MNGLTGKQGERDGRPLANRRAVLHGAAGIAVLGVAGCAGGPTMVSNDPVPTPQQQPGLAPIGTGPVQVAMLLPLTAQGNAGITGQALRNSAELAISEIQGAQVTITPFDTAGTPAGAQAATQQAVQLGARAIIGPLFASSVIATGQIATGAGIPVIAFSSDPNAAGRGVYLLSFLADADISRIVSYAVSQNRRSFAALLPATAYGQVAEAALRRTAAERGAQVVSIERYEADAVRIQEAVTRMAPVIAGPQARADSLLIPDNASALGPIASALAVNRVDVNRLKLLGSGQWNDPGVRAIPTLSGGWYPAPDENGFRSFSARYRARFGSEPPRIATLAYDAVTLSAALARINPGNPYSAQVLTNADGFSGIDGIFRFRPDGTNQRGLAVYEVRGGAPSVLDPAPRSFTGT
ncbi:MAG: penicillin-binding protein activator [Pseudomonadota bacterium]